MSYSMPYLLSLGILGLVGGALALFLDKRSAKKNAKRQA